MRSPATLLGSPPGKADVEWAIINNAQNKAAAAKSLGISAGALRRHLKRWGWEARLFRSRDPRSRIY